MRFAVIGERASLVGPDGATLDIAHASHGRFSPDPIACLQAWDRLVGWAQRATIAGPAFDPAQARAPVPAPRQIFAIGLNYRDHQIETGLPEPECPLVFGKWPSSISAPLGEVVLDTETVGWEAELAVVIGRPAYRVSADLALGHVAGITAAQDFSCREVQFRPTTNAQFSLGKSFRSFTPMGPLLVSLDELDDPADVPVACLVNGKTVQSSSTCQLIFSIAELIEHISWVLPLGPGDVILTGTPGGVGLGMAPPRFLRPGDTVVTRVGPLTMRHRMVAPDRPARRPVTHTERSTA